jgi:hypothetical protein
MTTTPLYNFPLARRAFLRFERRDVATLHAEHIRLDESPTHICA